MLDNFLNNYAEHIQIILKRWENAFLQLKLDSKRAEMNKSRKPIVDLNHPYFLEIKFSKKQTP